MMDNSHIREAFAQVRPVCVALTKEHTRRNVQAFRETIGKMDNDTIQSLQDYILFPLRMLLKQSQQSSQEFYKDIVSCLNDILGRTKIHDVKVSQDIFTVLCLLISSPEPGKEDAKVTLSEEMKLTTVHCLSTLITKSDNGGGLFLHSAPFLPALGHAVSMLLQLIRKEQMRELRIQSMQCLLHLTLVNHSNSKGILVNAGTTFASFLPGISLCLCEVITAGGNQTQSVTSKSIETWTEILCLILSDKYLTKSQEECGTGGDIDDKLRKLIVTRKKEWVNSTVGKLQILIDKVSHVINHKNWKIRLAMVNWASKLLLECTESLSICRPCLLQVLVRAVGDDYSTVTDKATLALNVYKKKLQGPETKTLVELLQENLYELATSLPRIIRTSDDDKKLAMLKLFTGYLKLLGKDANSILLSYSQLKRLGQALILVLELDCSPLKILLDRSELTMLESGYSSRPQKLKKHFKHFHEELVYQEIATVCHLLGTNGDLVILIDYFTEEFHCNSICTKQCIIILNEIILGYSKKEETDCESNIMVLEDTMRSLLEVYLSSELLDIPTTCTSSDSVSASQAHSSWDMVQSDSKQPSLVDINSNIWQLCLLLEGIGNIAKVLQEEFRLCLMDVLYPVLEKLGSETVAVSHTAYLTLLDICHSCKYISIEDLVYDNADYLINSISLRLRKPAHIIKAPVVLKMMIQNSGPKLLPLVQDTVTEIVNVLDEHYDSSSLSLIRVLSSLVVAISNWYPPSIIKTKSKPQIERYRSFDDVVKFFTEYVKLKDIAAGNVNENDLNDDGDHTINDDSNEHVDEDKKKEIPKHVQIVKLIMERCRHLLSNDKVKVKVVVLETIAQSCTALSDYEEELLPLLHQVWPGLVPRFSDEEPVVCLKAFDTLTILSNSAGEFLYKRVLTDILPKLESFLVKQAEISIRAGPAYKFTQKYKYQLSVLQKVGGLCKQIGLGQIHLDKIMRAVLPYLSARQPKNLQVAGVKAFEVFGELEPDSVWLLLTDVYSTDSYQPPDETFAPINVEWRTERNEYTDNVTKILSNEVFS